jgi:Tfp pilus assembly protein PilF
MLTLALVLLLQGLPSIADTQAFRLQGVVTANGQPVRVDIVLKDSLSATIGTAQSFANGTFAFDNVRLGRYSITVSDSRFNLFDEPLLLREMSDPGKKIIINLVPRSSDAPAETESVNWDELKGKIPAEAIAELRSGLEALKTRPKLNPAESHFKRATDIAPEFYEAHFQLGLEWRRQQRRADAITEFVRAAAIKPELARPFRILGGLYIEEQQYQKAVDALMKVGQLGTLDSKDRLNLGTAFYKLNNFNAAEEQLLTSINLSPKENPGVYLQLHNVYMAMREPLAALKVLEDYLKFFPTEVNAKAMTDRAAKLRDALKKP